MSGAQRHGRTLDAGVLVHRLFLRLISRDGDECKQGGGVRRMDMRIVLGPQATPVKESFISYAVCCDGYSGQYAHPQSMFTFGQ